MLTVYIGHMEDLNVSGDTKSGVGLQIVEGEDNVLYTQEITQQDYDALKEAGAEEV